MSGAPGVTRTLAFSVRLRVPVGDIVERTGILVEGPAGWGEVSPLPTWGAQERAAARRAAEEAAVEGLPPSRRTSIPVNALVPRVAPEVAARLAVESGCSTIKIKVGDGGARDRVAAVRDALGAGALLRLDANGSWDVPAAVAELAALAPLGIELVEDPVSALSDLAEVRRRSPIPVAAEMSVRSLEAARELRRLGAADAVVVKPQRIGGVRPALLLADQAGVPAIASSALETSVGLRAVAALAAALPEGPHAHGVGTALLLETDVTSRPLLPEGGRLSLRPVEPDLLAHTAARG